MMDLWSFALICCAAVAVYARYKAVTLRASLDAREAMIEDVKSIIDDDNASVMLKKMAISGFTSSINSRVVLSALWAIIRSKGKIPLIPLNSDEKERFDKLVLRHFVRVNMNKLLCLAWLMTFSVTTLADTACPAASGDERRVCLQGEIDKEHHAVAALLKRIERIMRDSAHFERWKQDFKQEQAAWQDYSVRHCDMMLYLWGGSGVNDAILSCQLRLIVAREKELASFYQLPLPGK